MEQNVRSLTKNSGILTVANSGMKLMSFLLMPLYTRVLSAADYGVTDTILNLALLAVAAFSLCIDWGVTAFYYDEKTLAYERRITTGSSVFCLLAAGVCLLCAGAARPLSQLLFRTPRYTAGVALGFIYAAVKISYFAFRVGTRMRGRLKSVALFSLAELATLLVLNILLILVFKVGYMAILYANVASQVVCGALYAWGNRGYVRRSCVDRPLLGRVLRYCAPLTPVALLTWFNSFADRYFIGQFHDQTAVGLYGRAFQMVTLLSVFTTAFLASYPAFAYSNARDESKRPQYAVIFDALAGLLAVLAVFITLFAKEILQVMTAPAFHDAYRAVGLLAFGHVFYTLGNVMSYGITIQKNARLYLLVNGSAAVCNVALNLLLVPRFGFVGAAATTCAAQLLAMLLGRPVAEKLFRCNYRWIRALLLLAALLAVGYWGGELPFVLKIPVLAVCVAAVVLLYRDRFSSIRALLRPSAGSAQNGKEQ